MRCVFVTALVLLSGCSLASPPYDPPDYAKVMGPIAEAKDDAEAAARKVPLAEESYVNCFVGYAVEHSQAAATASEVSEAATVACWPQLDHLRRVYYDARSKAARVAELERGTMRPDIAAGVESDVKRIEQLARGKALDLVVRARTPREEAIPVIEH